MPDEYREKRRWLNKFYFRNLIIPFLLAVALVIRAGFFQRRRDPSAFAEVDPSSIIEISLVLLALPFVLSKRGVRAIRLLFYGPLKYYIFYTIWCLITTFWSSDVVYSIFRVIELIVALFTFAYIFIDIRSKEYAKKVLLYFVIISLIAGIGYYLKSGWFSFERFHSNAYPMLSAAGVVIGLFIYKDRKYFDYDFGSTKSLALLLLFISVIGIIYGTSSASNVSLTMAIIFLATIKRNNVLTILLVTISLFGAWLLWDNYQTQIMDIIFPGKSLNSIKTGTGRTGMWKYYIDGFLERPLFGYGFPTGEKEGMKFGWVTTSTSHNMFISVAINTGIVGLLLFFAFIFKYSWFLITKLRGGLLDFRWITGAWIVFVVNSMSLPALGSHWLWITSSIFCIMVYSVFYYK